MRQGSLLVTAAAAVLAGALLGGCDAAVAQFGGDERHPRAPHSLIPEYSGKDAQIASGSVTGEAPEQPIAFTHKRHVTVLGIDCQYCHAEARSSIHAGVPETQVCMGCHKFVKTDAPEIQRLTEYWQSGAPIPWKKVHDLPDYVHFEHKRHVRAGVDCTECHGQVGLMEGVRITAKGHGPEDVAATEAPGEGHGEPTAVTEQKTYVSGTMTRETTLQMGWCLDCHGSHPSIDENYGDLAELRRAELKDCWTCHK